MDLKENKTTNLIFVYGTLMSMFGNHRLISRSKNSMFIGKATTNEMFSMYSLGQFPAVLRPIVGSNKTKIKGEVWKVDDDTLKNLDRLENHPTWYKREKIKCTLEDNTEIEVQIYIMQNENYHKMFFKLILDGDFENFQKSEYN